MSEFSKQKKTTAGWYGRARGSIGAITTIMMMVSLMTTVPAYPQGSSASDMGMDLDRLPSGGKGNTNTTSSGSRQLYHVDVTESGEPCVHNGLLDRVVDPATYEFGCRDIEVRGLYQVLWLATNRKETPNILQTSTFTRQESYSYFLSNRPYAIVWCASQHMLTGPKTLVGSGSVRDVWLVEYKGRTVVTKTLRHMDDPRHRDMHMREMLTMDVVSEVGAPPDRCEV